MPAICPDVPHLERSPVILYFSDAFKKPCPFEPHVLVDIDDQFERLMDMLHCHVSQFYEWLPFNAGHLDQVPASDADRRRWLGERISRRLRPLADRYRETGQVEKAEQLYKQLLTAQPTTQGYGALAASLFKRKKTDELLKVMTEAITKPGGGEASGEGLTKSSSKCR